MRKFLLVICITSVLMCPMICTAFSGWNGMGDDQSGNERQVPLQPDTSLSGPSANSGLIVPIMPGQTSDNRIISDQGTPLENPLSGQQWNTTQNGQFSGPFIYPKPPNQQTTDSGNVNRNDRSYVIVLQWSGDDNKIALRSIELNTGYFAPDYLSGGDWRFQMVNRNGAVLEQANFRFDTNQYSDAVDNGQWTGNSQPMKGAQITLITPFHDDAYIFSVYDPQGNVRFSYDLSKF